MTTQEMMERTGMTEPNRFVAYLKDGLREVQLITQENIVRKYTNLIKDKRRYRMPEDLIQMQKLSIKYNDKFIRISRIVGDITDEIGDV